MLDFGTWIRQKTGCRVQKLAVDAGFSCPNRDGRLSSGGCTFCNNEAFNTSYCDRSKSVTAQLEDGKRFFNRKKAGMKYLAYFQAYSNTYAPLPRLKALYEEALSVKDIVGIVIGTRPDCVNGEILDYLEELSHRTFVLVEYGVESCNDETLRRINRGHDFACSQKAIEETHRRGIYTCAHLILGLPGEGKVYDFFSLGFGEELTPDKSLSDYTRKLLEKDTDGKLKKFLLYMLRVSDFNINNIKVGSTGDDSRLYFGHSAHGDSYELSESYESRGTIRFLGMAAILQKLLFNSCFVSIDELESSMHYELLSYFIRVFLANSSNTSQLLFTTHDINLLNEDFIRRDAVWFTDKDNDAETHLLRLSNMGLHKTMSPYNAYRQGKLINLPFLGSQYLDLNEVEK